MHLFTAFLDTSHCWTGLSWDVPPSPAPSSWGEHIKDKEQPFNRWEVVFTLQVGCDFLTQLNTYRQKWRQGEKARRCLSERSGQSNIDWLARACSCIFKSHWARKIPEEMFCSIWELLPGLWGKTLTQTGWDKVEAEVQGSKAGWQNISSVSYDSYHYHQSKNHNLNHCQSWSCLHQGHHHHHTLPATVDHTPRLQPLCHPHLCWGSHTGWYVFACRGRECKSSTSAVSMSHHLAPQHPIVIVSASPSKQT